MCVYCVCVSVSEMKSGVKSAVERGAGNQLSWGEAPRVCGRAWQHAASCVSGWLHHGRSEDGGCVPLANPEHP